jgi:hypothetical protein
MMLKLANQRSLRLRVAAMAAACTFVVLGCVNLHAQVKVQRVAPEQTDAAIETVHGPHLAVYDPQVASNHRLFVFLVGTGAKAESSLTIDSAFAGWGYRVISLDYENTVLAASCVHSTDIACFDDYREAIVTGAPVSAKISVNRANSILNRLQKLLVYLVQHDPEGAWGEFVVDGQPDWSRIVIAGHSQGSGHAAYIGKMFRVDRVLMFSGPQDYLDGFDKPAPWQARAGATPPSRYFAFLNENDPFNVHHQIANCAALMGLKNPEPMTIDAGKEIQGNQIQGDHQILINDLTQGPHGSTLRPQFENVWKYMVTAGALEAVSAR